MDSPVLTVSKSPGAMRNIGKSGGQEGAKERRSELKRGELEQSTTSSLSLAPYS